MTLLEGWRQRDASKAVGKTSLHTGILLGLQLLIGAFIAWSGFSASAQAVHLATASAVWIGVAAVAAMAWLPIVSGQAGPHEGGEIEGRASLGDYIALMKPRIILLLLVTALGGMFLAQGGLPSLSLMTVVLVGGTLAAGGANALNHYYDRDIDSAMRRTQRRPLPANRIPPQDALLFGLALNALSFVLLATFANVLSAVLAVSGSIFYVLVYTRWLKRTTPEHRYWGAAGAIPPLVRWAAVTGGLGLLPSTCSPSFFWTPPPLGLAG
jgi:protoheme IX farnesyltransferase